MSLGIFQATIVDEFGNVQAGAEVQVFDESTGLLAELFSDKLGTALDNPFFTSSDGFAEFYANNGEYRISAVKGIFSRTWRYVQIGDTAQRDTGTDFDQVPLNTNIVYPVATVADMKALSGVQSGQNFYLSAGGRSGMFVILPDGDYSAAIAADPLEGVFIELDTGQVAIRESAYETGQGRMRILKPEWFADTVGYENGSLDDTAAIQACLDIGGHVVLRPKMTYYHSGLSFERDKTWLQGGGESTELILLAGSNADSITNDSGSARYLCFLSDLRLDGNGTSQTSGSTIHVHYANGWKLWNLFVEKGCDDNVRITGDSSFTTIDTYIHHCRIFSSGDHGINMAAYSATLEVSGCIISAAGSSGIRINNVDTRITNNHLHSNGDYGILLESRNGQFVGNHCESNNKDGIKLYGAESCVVNSNISVRNSRSAVPDLYSGISVSGDGSKPTKNCTIVGNRCWSQDITENGVLVQRHGISIDTDQENLVVTDNVLTGNQRNGLEDKGAILSIINNNIDEAQNSQAMPVEYWDGTQTTDITKTLNVSITDTSSGHKGVVAVFEVIYGANNLANNQGVVGIYHLTITKTVNTGFIASLYKVSGDDLPTALAVTTPINTSTSLTASLTYTGKGITISARQLQLTANSAYFSSSLSIT